MEFLLASSNPHKAEEFSELFSGTNIQIISAPKKLDVVEDGETFLENALLKARAYYNEFNVATIADDSGLVVQALPNDLGIHSARFAPECENYEKKCTKLISMLDGKSDVEKSAYFVCCLCIYLSEDEIFNFEGRVKGHIGDEIKGSDGFGYDPIFVPEGLEQTLAQVPTWKNENSHRARAVVMAREFFKNKFAK
jgi:XTP/dITP diphosphohydrolase